ncbi:unnamed protein product [Sphenostylis stenocarpa]|uniref:Uncharacterized protein n=1 Tax=Sphenostylis stenocarpa TaxID=92480 RepID=A0AA86SJE5_9FABA|nr:unnamed protein product [Sphenostylis stenocarpa]
MGKVRLSCLPQLRRFPIEKTGGFLKLERRKTGDILPWVLQCCGMAGAMIDMADGVIQWKITSGDWRSGPKTPRYGVMDITRNYIYLKS